MFHASLLSIAAGRQPFNCSAAVNQLMQEHHFSAFLHQFPDLYRRPGREPGRVQMRSDAWPLILPPHASTPFPGLMHEHPFFVPCITSLHCLFQRKRIDDELSFSPPFVVNSNHLLMPYALICIRFQKPAKRSQGIFLLAGS